MIWKVKNTPLQFVWKVIIICLELSLRIHLKWILILERYPWVFLVRVSPLDTTVHGTQLRHVKLILNTHITYAILLYAGTISTLLIVPNTIVIATLVCFADVKPTDTEPEDRVLRGDYFFLYCKCQMMPIFLSLPHCCYWFFSLLKWNGSCI